MTLRLALCAALIIVSVYGLAVLLRWLSPWLYDPRNPARRWCKRCGQRQELYGMNWAEGFRPTGWETMYPIKNNPRCNHK